MPSSPHPENLVNDPLRVLIVDDDKDVRTLLSFNLLTGPVEIVGEATNGQEGVDLALELKPDIVVMDLMMPIMDGAEATMIIKKQLPSVAVFGFSAADARGVEGLLRAGAAGVFSKDKLSELLDAMERDFSP